MVGGHRAPHFGLRGSAKIKQKTYARVHPLGQGLFNRVVRYATIENGEAQVTETRFPLLGRGLVNWLLGLRGSPPFFSPFLARGALISGGMCWGALPRRAEGIFDFLAITENCMCSRVKVGPPEKSACRHRKAGDHGACDGKGCFPPSIGEGVSGEPSGRPSCVLAGVWTFIGTQ